MPSNVTLGDLWMDDPEFAAIIHPYWRQFLIPDPMFNYVCGIYVGVVGILGILGNAFVVLMFSLSKNLRTPANILVINLAICDGGFSLVNGFPLKTISAFNQRWSYGKFACELYGVFSGIFGFGSIASMMFIALDRYFVIAQPIQAFARMTYKRATTMVLISWIWSCTWVSGPFFGIGRFIPEGYQTSCGFDYISQDWNNRLFNAGLYIFGFSLPILITVVCYTGIVVAVRRNEQNLKAVAKKLNAENPISMKSGSTKADVEAAKTSALLVLLFVLTWLPYALVCLTSMLGYLKSLRPWMTEAPGLFSKTAAAYNPILYAIKHPKYKAEIRKRFPCLGCCCLEAKKVATVQSENTL